MLSWWSSRAYSSNRDVIATQSLTERRHRYLDIMEYSGDEAEALYGQLARQSGDALTRVLSSQCIDYVRHTGHRV